MRGDSEEQRGFPGGPPSPPYGRNPQFGEPDPEARTAPPAPPTARVASAPPPPRSTEVPPTIPPPPSAPTGGGGHAQPWRNLAIVAVAGVLVATVWFLAPAGHSVAPRRSVAPPTTLAEPSPVTFPPQGAADLANCPHAVTSTSAPFGPASTTVRGDLPLSGTGRISGLAWSIPIGPVEDPRLTSTPMYIVGQAGGTVVVSDASSGDQTAATLVGLTESTGSPKWAITIPRSLGASAGTAELPILDPAGSALSYAYAEGTQVRAATIALSSGSLVACDLVGDPSALGGPPHLYPVSGGLYASITDSNGAGSLVRLAVGSPSWSTTSGFDTVLGGNRSVLVVGHDLTSGTPGSTRSPADQSVAGLDAGTGRLLWKEPVSTLVGDRSLRNYDRSPAPQPATGNSGGLPYEGSSYGTLDGVSSGGETSFLWAPRLQADSTGGASSPSRPSYLLTVQDATGRLAWGGWSAGNSFGPLTDGVGGVWLAAGPPGPSVEWLSIGPTGAAKGFPTQGYKAAAGGGRILVSTAIPAPGSQYGTEVLADRTGQIGTLSMDSADLSYDTQANGALSDKAWTGIARYDTVANLSAGRSPDYAIVCYRIGGGSGAGPGTGAPSDTTIPTAPPRVGGQGGTQ